MRRGVHRRTWSNNLKLLAKPDDPTTSMPHSWNLSLSWEELRANETTNKTTKKSQIVGFVMRFVSFIFSRVSQKRQGKAKGGSKRAIVGQCVKLLLNLRIAQQNIPHIVYGKHALAHLVRRLSLCQRAVQIKCDKTVQNALPPSDVFCFCLCLRLCRQRP